MIQTEMVEGRIRHYSDNGMMMRQIETGVLYEDAVDYVPCKYTYEETDEPIPDYPIEPQEALNILMGENDG